MKTFTSGILHNNTLLTFSFDKIDTVHGAKFSVTGMSTDEEIIRFDMKMDIKGNWNVVTPAPLWIKHLELQFNQLLTEQVKYQTVFN